MGTSKILFCSNFLYNLQSPNMDRTIIGTAAAADTTAETPQDIGLVKIKKLVLMPPFKP
jgi:hypothetical protein